MISQKEVYDNLNYHWQTTRDIRRRIAELRNKEIFDIPLGTVFVCLDKLVNEGLVETQEREPTEEEAGRRGYRVKEYRKANGGEPLSDYEDSRDLGLAIA